MRYGKPSIADAPLAGVPGRVASIESSSCRCSRSMLPRRPRPRTARVMALGERRLGRPADRGRAELPWRSGIPRCLGGGRAASPRRRRAPTTCLFSFHGLPARHIQKSDPTGAHCLRGATLLLIGRPPTCYRAQCFATARALADRLSIADHTVCFQSRLGRTPWIEPYTDVVIDQLAKRGIKRVAVMCPAFVADCLETIEEIGIRGRATVEGSWR